MALVIGLLTAVMVLVCLILILLVLMQLPKKDAGAGLAFGGAATDALFGAGSGNFLTKATKYVATLFFVLTIFISVLQAKYVSQGDSELRRALEAPVATQGTAPLTPLGAPPEPARGPGLITAPVSTNTAPE